MDLDEMLRDVTVLGARLVLGGTLAAHGAQKLFGWFGGPGPEKTAQMMHSLGMRPSERTATMASATEITAGTLIALGLGGPVGPAMLTSVMLVAIETVHRPKGYWNTGGGWEMNAMYLSLAAVLANRGYGSLSLDHVIGVSARMRPLYAWLAIAGGIGAAIAMLAQRQVEQPTTIRETIEEKAESPA